MHDHLGPGQQWGDLRHLRQIGLHVSLVREQIVGGGQDVGGQQFIRQLGQGPAQAGAKRPARAGQNDFLHLVIPSDYRAFQQRFMALNPAIAKRRHIQRSVPAITDQL